MLSFQGYIGRMTHVNLSKKHPTIYKISRGLEQAGR